jgi:plasmid stabilization system protein ParE
MRKIVLSKEAGDYLRHERLYVARFNPRASDNMVRQLWSAFRMLAGYPQAGAVVPHLPGRRSYVAGAYIINYRVEPNAILISHIRHGRQLAPDLEPDDGPDIGDGG